MGLGTCTHIDSYNVFIHGFSASVEWHNFCTFCYCVSEILNLLSLNLSNVAQICLKYRKYQNWIDPCQLRLPFMKLNIQSIRDMICTGRIQTELKAFVRHIVKTSYPLVESTIHSLMCYLAFSIYLLITQMIGPDVLFTHSRT